MRAAAFLVVALAAPMPVWAQPRPVDRKDDAALLRDEAKAIPEMQRRLRDLAALKDGLVIQDLAASGANLMVMPPTAFWSVDCGEAGISVTFGTGNGDTDNGITLQLTSVAVSQERCVAMAPPIGRTAILKGE